MNPQNNTHNIQIVEEIIRNRKKYIGYVEKMLKGMQYECTAEDVIQIYCIKCLENKQQNHVEYLNSYIYNGLKFTCFNLQTCFKNKKLKYIEDDTLLLNKVFDTFNVEADIDNVKNKDKFNKLCKDILTPGQLDVILNTINNKVLVYNKYNTMKTQRRLAVEKLKKGVKSYGIEIFE